MSFNFHVETAQGVAPGVMPYVELADGWHEGVELLVKTADGWRTVWRRQVVFINELQRTGASIYELMGSPTKARDYVFINRALISGGANGYALRTGVFPAGSTLTIINENEIIGSGGNGGGYNTVAAWPGGSALYVEFPCSIDTSLGIIGGGGGGGGNGLA